MDRRRGTVLVVAVAVMLALAGCSGFGGTGGDSAGAGGSNGDGEYSADTAAGGGNDGGAAGESAGANANQLRFQQRQLIRTGTVRLRVNDTAAASDAIRDMTTERGGFVSASNRRVRERHNETWTTERIVIRVPSDAFERTVDDVKALGRVRNAETSTEDVTDQLVDIEARLKNLRAERDRLRELYQQANETEDVLAVQRELADVQEEIERLEARKAALERDVAYSTITIELEEEPPDAPEPAPETAWYETGLLTAFLDSVGGVVTTLRAIAVAAAYLAPYVLVFGTPVAGVLAWRRWR